MSDQPGLDGERPPVSVIVVTGNSMNTIALCIEFLFKTTTDRDELILIDNASRDETVFFVENMMLSNPGREIRLFCQQGWTGHPGLAMQAADKARHDYLVFLQPDAVVFEGWVEGLLAPLMESEDIAAAGPVTNTASGPQGFASYLPEKYREKELKADDLASILQNSHQSIAVSVESLAGFCLAVRREALEKIEGMDENIFGGLWDIDLSWRLIETGYQLVVVPSVFVVKQGGDILSTDPQKNAVYLAQQSANQLYEKLYKIYNGSVPTGKERWGIDRFRPQEELLSIVMPVYTEPRITRKSLESIVKHTRRPYEVILIDNDSDEKTRAVIADFAAAHPSKVRIIRNQRNQGYPRACNQGMEAASGEYSAVINNDVLVTPYWASRMMAAFTVDPRVGVVGPRSNYTAGPQRVTECGYNEITLDAWAQNWYSRHAGLLYSIPRLIGFLMMIKREVIERIGGFDPLFGLGNYDDDDYSLRVLLAGYRPVVAGDVFVHHYGSRSFRKDPELFARMLNDNRLLFEAKWGVKVEPGMNYYDWLLQSGMEKKDFNLYVPLDKELD